MYTEGNRQTRYVSHHYLMTSSHYLAYPAAPARHRKLAPSSVLLPPVEPLQPKSKLLSADAYCRLELNSTRWLSHADPCLSAHIRAKPELFPPPSGAGRWCPAPPLRHVANRSRHDALFLQRLHRAADQGNMQ